MNTQRNRNALILFFVLAFLLPWLVWGTTIAESRGLLSFHIPQSLAFWIGLTLATYATAAITGGWTAVRDILMRLVRWRVQPVWYVVALGVTAMLSVIAIGVYRILGGENQVGVLLSTQNIVPALLFQTFFFLITEETAWRGFALPRLQASFSALNASLILGILWGVWHLPLFFIPDSFQSQLPFAGFMLATIAMSIISTWVFNHTHGSVLLVAILHAATDVTIAYSNVMSGAQTLFWIFVGVQCIFAALLVIWQGSAYLSRDPDCSTTVVPAQAG